MPIEIKKNSRDFLLSSVFLTLGTVFGVLLIIWTANEQYQTYKVNQHGLISNSINSVASEISNRLNERTRVLSAIAHDNYPLLQNILNEPDNERLVDQFEQRLKAYFPHFLAFTIVDQDGNRAPDDFGEYIGDQCLRDISNFSSGDHTLTTLIDNLLHYQPVIHPQSSSYHFDIMAQVQNTVDSTPAPKLILFISFPAGALANIIKEHQSPNEQIYLVHLNDPDLIEVSVAGSRDKIKQDHRLSEADKGDLFIHKDVHGSRWKIVGFPKKGLLAEQVNALISQYSILILMIVFFYVCALFILDRLTKQKNLAFQQMHSLNQYLEDVIIERTQELTKLSSAVIQSPVEILITDLSGTIEYINPEFTEKTGYTREEAIGANLLQLNAKKLDEELQNEIWTTVSEGQTWSGELLSQHKDGTTYWLRLSVSPIRNDDDKIIHFLAIGEDITEHKKQEQKIHYQAQYDALTGMPNRFLAIDRLEQAIQLCKRSDYKVVLIFIDLDNFKIVNDTLGHEYGDLLLIETAQKLNLILRESDTIARLGGDEFLIILSQVHEKKYIEQIAEKIIKTFQSPICIKDSECIITASLGISIFPDDGTDPQHLMRSADLAMYQSKENGRNGYQFFSLQLEQEAKKRFEIEKQLHQVLKQNELSVVYQPIFNLLNNQIEGCEVLARWHSPILGTVPPDVFIPIAEQNGLISAIGEFVLQTASEQLASWKTSFQTDLFVAVNLSPRQFWEKDFVNKLLTIIRQAELPPESLELEVTEGMVIKNHQDTEFIMHNLSNMGIKLSMDDFGTGYSSLYHLKKFRFDKLKIDRSFIQELTEDSSDITLIQTTIALAHGLGLRVVAEGIETEQQLQILKNEKCDYGQGYFLSRPITAEDFAANFLQDG